METRRGTQILNIFKRIWIPLVAVAAVALGSLGVIQLRGYFGSDGVFSLNGRTAETIRPITPKRVTYELFGPGNTRGSVSYLNKNSEPETTDFMSLPWTYTITTTTASVIANVVAQGDSDSIGCRIIVNGEIRDEQSSSGRNAQTFCLVKAA